jgi:hypothetical protein
MGFRRKTKKFSARIMRKRMNFFTRIFSISSACRHVRGWVGGERARMQSWWLPV